VSDAAERFWCSEPRAIAPHPERAESNDTAVNRVLLGLLARLRKPFGRDLKRAGEFVALVDAEQPWAEGLSDAELLEAAQAMRPRLLREGFTPQHLARCFALVRAAATRTLGMTHFPVQIMGGWVMLQGMLAEMATGEGKTLTATLPAATVAMAGLPVHVITVNDYLAKRDSEIMGPVYRALGLSVGLATHEQSPPEKQAAYAANICYCTNKDIGFDYLKDSLTLEAHRGRARLLLEKALQRGDRIDRLLLRGLQFAIVDEIDSVLVDEARTPLIIAGNEQRETDEHLYQTAIELVAELEDNVDFKIDREDKAARLTEKGRERLGELAVRLPEKWRSKRAREELVQQALSALHLFELDKHYLIRDGKVHIIDEYTGRVMPDRSWERGLHQLIEIKEGCELSARQGTLARITYQRLFLRYLRVGGMSGTVEEIRPELEAVYGLRTVPIPPNRPCQRRDLGCRVYATTAQKWEAVASTIATLQAEGRPVLVGTRSVAASEELSSDLERRSIDHVVLNARQDDVEAGIVEQAGSPGRVTVATNMAGRGTDIHLADATREVGGLHVILTEFHESPRIDRQLYGRCARQGDPGTYEAIVSLEDEIFQQHAAKSAHGIATRYAGRSGPLPRWTGTYLRMLAQRSAEWKNAQTRRATIALDKKLDSALGFAGRTE
jgi:preprotein translocase subunit SecA